MFIVSRSFDGIYHNTDWKKIPYPNLLEKDVFPDMDFSEENRGLQKNEN